MIIDFRYHVASLVAVFLALGMGILIGGAVLGNAALEKELGQIQEDLVKLRTDQRELNTQIEERNAELRVYQQFGASVLPGLVKNKLLGKRVALVRTSPHTDPKIARDLTRLFQTAGAKVNSTTVFLRDPAELDPVRLQALGGKLGLAQTGPERLPAELLRTAIDRIANGPMFAEDNKRNILTSLAGSKLIETSGDYGGMVDILVLIGGSLDENVDTSRQVDRVLIETVLEAKGLMVAAVEPSNAARSYLPEYLKHAVIVVDNIESPPGQVALILALMRGRRGHYGVHGAGQLLPEVL